MIDNNVVECCAKANKTHNDVELRSSKQPVETLKKASKDLPVTKPKSNKQPISNVKQEPQRNKKPSKDLSTNEPHLKRACKTLNKKERKDLSEYFKSGNDDVLMFAVHSKSLEQPFPSTTNDFVEILFENKGYP